MALTLLCKYLLKAFVCSVSILNVFQRNKALHFLKYFFLLLNLFLLLDKEQALQNASPYHGSSQRHREGDCHSCRHPT